MYITGITHRDELFELTLRWLNDDLHVDDGRIVTRIFLYESAISALVVDRMIYFLGKIFMTPLHAERIDQKQLLRECIIQYLPHQSLRSRQLSENFRENPEYFFPRLPIDAVLITDFSPRLSAICRIKRRSRVAEKLACRMAHVLSGEIRSEALQLAINRLKTDGVPPPDLAGTVEPENKDFAEAEVAVSRRFKSKNVCIAREDLAVNDIIGFKIIGDTDLLERVPSLLQQESGVSILEIEEHTGNYNAVNLLVDIELPKPDTLAAYLAGIDWSIAACRGLNANEMRKGVTAYVAEGSRSIRIEIILTTYDELMESEFGRSMHELRVLRLRQCQSCNGPIAQNARYLFEYLFALASSPSIDIPELPFKMYGRYLPESITVSKCALCGNDIDGGLFNAFCVKPDCLNRFCLSGGYVKSCDDATNPREASHDIQNNFWAAGTRRYHY